MVPGKKSGGWIGSAPVPGLHSRLIVLCTHTHTHGPFLDSRSSQVEENCTPPLFGIEMWAKGPVPVLFYVPPLLSPPFIGQYSHQSLFIASVQNIYFSI